MGGTKSMTIKIHYKAHSTVAVLAVALLAAPILASGARAADFYKGETIQIFVGFGAGGSYDGYSRLVARHLGRLIPGQPKIIVSNMPGAGGLKAANYLYKIAPQNGTALGVVAEAAALSAAGPKAHLIATRQVSADRTTTCALAERVPE